MVTTTDQVRPAIAPTEVSPPELPALRDRTPLTHPAEPFPNRSTPQGEWSESIQAVLEQPPATLPRYLVLAGIGFMSFFSMWSYVGQFQDVATAAGELTPKGETYKIQLSTAGEIEQILVAEGDQVKKGELLLALDADLIEREIERLMHTKLAAEKELTQVRSLIANAQPESLAQAAIATANIQAQQSSIQQSQVSTQTSEALLQGLQQEMSAQTERLNRISTLEAKGAISQEYLFGIEQGVRNQQQAISKTQGEINQSVAYTQQMQSELAQKTAAAQQAQINSQQSLQRLKIEAEQLEAKLTDTQSLVEQSQAKLAYYEVRSPIDGILSTLEIDNIGEVISTGKTLAEVVPAGMPLMLSAMVPQRDAGLIKIGMDTKIKLDAFPYQDYGTLSGTVVAISPDTKGTPETGTGYQVDISLDQDYVTHEQQSVSLQVGQTASAEIIVRQRRIIDWLLDPVRRLRADEMSL